MRSSNPQYTLTKWDVHFMRLAREASYMSKDPSTRVGAILASKHNRTVGTGYNGFPVNVQDTHERLTNKAIKYELVVHAEVNAVMNAIANPRGSRLYCLAFPCPRCAAVLIQAGITRVVAGYSPDYEERWADLIKLSKEMLTEAGIPFTHLDNQWDPFDVKYLPAGSV